MQILRTIKKKAATLLNKNNLLEYPKSQMKIAAGSCVSMLFELYTIASLNLSGDIKVDNLMLKRI